MAPRRPDFVVIGAEKSGTTSLYRYLADHPGIFMPPVKELNHLIDHPERRSMFQGPDVTFKIAVRSREEYWRVFADAPEGATVGELTHIYLYAPESPARIAEALGQPKLVAILRNPIDRAYAQYVFHRELGLEAEATFERSLEVEDGRVRAGWDPVYHYRRRGMYGEQLARYYERFDPASIRVYKFEEFFAEPAASMRSLYAFLGVDPEFVPGLDRVWVPGEDPRNPVLVGRPATGLPSRKPVDPSTRRMLADVFREDVLQLETLTGLSLRDWLEASA